MKRLKKLGGILLAGVLLVVLTIPLIPLAPAPLIYAAEDTFYSLPNDGRIYSASAPWATAWAATTGTAVDDDDATTMGGWYTGNGNGIISRGFLFFDTSSIPDGNVISSAILYIDSNPDYSGTAQDIVVTQGDATYPHYPLEAGDFDKSHYSGEAARVASSQWFGGYNTFTLNADGRSWINKEGITHFVLRCSRDIDNNPLTTTSEFGGSFNEYTGTDHDPKLVVTHATPAAPTVTTGAATDVTATTATLHGEITDVGDENADKRGFVWDTSTHGDPGDTPPVNSSYVTGETGDYWTETGTYGTGEFDHGITGLSEETTYYVRACAHNNIGWAYGDEINFAEYEESSKKLTIVGSSAGAQTNYQMRLMVHWGVGTDSGDDVYLGYDSQTDFDDVYFTESDGETLLDYWLEEGSLVESDRAAFRIEFDYIPVYPNEATFYLLYGDPGASTGSNGENTSPFFDGFPEDPGYPDRGVGTGSDSVTDGVITLTQATAGAGLDYGVELTASYPMTSTGNLMLEARVDPTTPGELHGFYFHSTESKSYYFIQWAGTQVWDSSGPSQTFDQMYSGGGLQTVYVVLDFPNISGNRPIQIMEDDDDTASAVSDYDWVLIRKYCSPEPSWSWIAEGAPSVTTQSASGETPSGATLSGTIISIGDSTPTQRGFDWGGGFEPFTIAVLADTQYASASYPAIYRQQTQWIVDNAEALNIQFVVHVGDIVGTASTTAQWVNADTAMLLLDNADIPNLVVPGNHDYETVSSRTLTNYNIWFPYTRYSGEDWYGGNYSGGSANMWGSFTVDGQEYLVMGLEFGPRDAVVTWADGIIDAHPNAIVILFTHSYMYGDGTRTDLGDDHHPSDYGLTDYNDGEDLWDNLVSEHSNIVLVTSGHHLNGPNARRTDYVDGQPINQVLQNWQLVSPGGGGWLRYYTFIPNENKITASTYSPYYSQYKTDSENAFDWEFRKEDTGYGGYPSSTVDYGSFGTGSFTEPLTGLTADREYYFRGKALNTQGWGYGTGLTFRTLEEGVTPPTPSAPYNFAASAGETQIDLTWTKGTGAVNSLVRWSTTTYPATTGSGLELYFGTGTSTSHTSLSSGTTIYYSIWSEAGGVYSTSKATTLGTTLGVAEFPPPNTLRIDDVRVFQDYYESGDQLFVLSYKILYETTPTEPVGDYFMIRIMDGGVLKAKRSVLFWGYRPAAIYLAGDGTLTWGGSYTIQIIGYEAMWGTPPETSYALSSTNWEGDDLTVLEDWCILTASGIEDYEGVGWTTYVAGYGTILSSYGGIMFRNAIPGLEVACPGLFSSGVEEIDLGVEDQPDPYIDLLDPSVTFGETVMTRFDNFGEHLGLGGTVVAGFFWFVVIALSVGGITKVTGSPTAGIVVVLPVLFAGTYLGVIPLAAVISLGLLAVIGLLANMWLARA